MKDGEASGSQRKTRPFLVKRRTLVRRVGGNITEESFGEKQFGWNWEPV